jgi:O-acetylhomoserine (thiol)-lyase
VPAIEWGADIVIHSATKFIGGHGTSIGGIVVEAGTFDWSNGRFPGRRRPVAGLPRLQFHETFGSLRLPDEAAGRDVARPRRGPCRRSTPSCSSRGLETLSLRMERHVTNALAVADVPRVARARVER